MKLNISQLLPLSFSARSAFVFSQIWSDFPTSRVERAAKVSYTKSKFQTDSIVPLFPLDSNTFSLEMWHGPTGSFKDLSMQIIPHLIQDKSMVITAMSGRTTIAAASGFSDNSNVHLMAFYPQNKLTAKQEKVLITQKHDNIICAKMNIPLQAIQAELREVFSDASLSLELSKYGYRLISLDSLPHGRTLPVALAFVSAYCSLVKHNIIEIGESIAISVTAEHSTLIKAIELARDLGLPIVYSARITIIPELFNEDRFQPPDAPLTTNVSVRGGGVKNFIRMMI